MIGPQPTSTLFPYATIFRSSFKATGGTLTIDSASTIHNTGAGATFEANGGNIVLSGDTVTNTGILNAAAGNTLELINNPASNTVGPSHSPAHSVLDLLRRAT